MDKENLTKEVIMLLNKKEINLITLLRGMTFGKVTVFIENSLPVRVEEIKESVKL